jgi:hypothetical protein
MAVGSQKTTGRRFPRDDGLRSRGLLSAIMAATKVMNWARTPGWRIAAKDRLINDGAVRGMDFVSLMKKHQCCVSGRHIRQHDALHTFERILNSDIIVRPALLSMVDRAPKSDSGGSATRWLSFEHDLSEAGSCGKIRRWSKCQKRESQATMNGW